jgi:signal peptidase I
LEATKKNEKVSIKKNIIDWAKFLVQLIVIYLIINNTIGLTKVYGLSMSPTLKDGSILMENKLSTHIGKPKYGDVVVLHQESKGLNIIKRVIGLPGDTISIKNSIVSVNGKPLNETYIQGKSNDMAEVKVADNCVFVIGDNRTPGESLDSRDPDTGAISIKAIKGYAMFSVFPFYNIAKP